MTPRSLARAAQRTHVREVWANRSCALCSRRRGPWTVHTPTATFVCDKCRGTTRAHLLDFPTCAEEWHDGWDHHAPGASPWLWGAGADMAEWITENPSGVPLGDIFKRTGR